MFCRSRIKIYIYNFFSHFACFYQWCFLFCCFEFCVLLLSLLLLPNAKWKTIWIFSVRHFHFFAHSTFERFLCYICYIMCVRIIGSGYWKWLNSWQWLKKNNQEMKWINNDDKKRRFRMNLFTRGCSRCFHQYCMITLISTLSRVKYKFRHFESMNFVRFIG